jgi:hypothetical protein
MADDRVDPRDATRPMPGRRGYEMSAGSIDMTAFEVAVVGESAAGPQLQWAVLWPDGRATVFDGEDRALLLARSVPASCILRRYVSAWVPQPPATA